MERGVEGSEGEGRSGGEVERKGGVEGSKEEGRSGGEWRGREE